MNPIIRRLSAVFSVLALILTIDIPLRSSEGGNLEWNVALPEFPWLTTSRREVRYDRRVGSHAGRV